MADPSSRRISSLSSADAASSSRASSTLYSPSPPPSRHTLHITTTTSSSSHRSASNPLPPGPLRARRQGATGGFLLDNGSRGSTTEQGLRYASSVNSGASTAVHRAVADTDPASMVDLILSDVSKRRHESAVSKQQQQQQQRPTVASALPGRTRASSQSSSFLIPPTPARSTFPSPQLVPLPWASEQKPRWAVGLQSLCETKFSEATIARATRCKARLELAALFKKLMEIESERGDRETALRGEGERTFEYNPLNAIRNRRVRNRKKIVLDIGPWVDPGKVEQWVEDVAVAIYSPAEEGPGGLPPPPQGEMRKLKRPKMDWIIEPEEMLADYYWVRCEENKRREQEREIKRRKRRSVKSLESYGDKKSSLDGGEEGLRHRTSDEYMTGRVSSESRKQRTTDGAREYHRFMKDGSGYESTATSSEEDGNSETDYLYEFTDDEDHTPDVVSDKSKHHKRRRKLGRIIRGRNGKKNLNYHKLDAEEKRRKQEADEMEWVASEAEEKYEIPVMSSQPEYRKSSDIDEEYESASAIKPASKISTLQTNLGGSKSSLDGLGITGATDRSEFVVPSIAISLSPPRHVRSNEPEDKDDSKSPARKILGMRKDSAKESDSGRESLDIDRNTAYTSTKPNKKLGKVKSRVDRLRNEVGKVEDLLPWKRESSAPPSPSPSNDTASDDEDQAVRDCNYSASEREDGPRRRRSALDIPIRPSKHRSSFSTGQINNFFTNTDRAFRRSFESERSSSPHPKTVRERSSTRKAKAESRRRPKASDQLALLDPQRPSPPPPPQQSIKRDLAFAHVTLISSGIVARSLVASSPHTCNSSFRTINSRARHIDELLSLYRARQGTFASEKHRIDAVTKSLEEFAVRDLADDADRLSMLVTTELTLGAKRAQEEIVAVRRGRRRGGARLVKNVVSKVVEWTVVGLMWVLWAVVFLFRITRAVFVGAVRGVRWVLWL